MNSRSSRRFWILALSLCALVWLSGTGMVLAQDPNECDVAGEAPDVIVGDLHQVQRFGSLNDMTAYSVGTTSCNVGTCWLNWFSQTTEHPVIGQNMYRLKDGRYEQIGQSWLKHGFFALSDTLCDGGCIGTSGTHLGVNCSDPYSSGLNGQQSNLGPKSEVNAATGQFLYPYGSQGLTGDTLYKRLQVHNDDLDPALNSGALYFVEGQYVTEDDAVAGNSSNNASYRKVTISENGSGVYNLNFDGDTQRELAGVQAWSRNQAGVKEATVDVSGDGRFVLASARSSIGGGLWHYQYAVQNLTSHRSASAFRVPLPVGATITNIEFNDVDYHSGEPYDGTDWVGVHDTDRAEVIWRTDDESVNPNANALRWGTMYSFGFDADIAPAFGPVALELFRAGSPTEGSAATFVPRVCNADGVCDPHETCQNCASDCVNAQVECCGDATCDPGEDSCACAADCGPPPVVESVCGDVFDDDCDGNTDCDDLDCCMDGLCADGIDADTDGVAECDCDDNNGLVWDTPGELFGLLLDGGGVTELSWDPPFNPGGLDWEYEMLRTEAPVGFDAANCVLIPDPLQEVGQDGATPPGGIVYHYLVRAVNNCPAGEGPLGTTTQPVDREGRSCP